MGEHNAIFLGCPFEHLRIRSLKYLRILYTDNIGIRTLASQPTQNLAVEILVRQKADRGEGYFSSRRARKRARKRRVSGE